MTDTGTEPDTGRRPNGRARSRFMIGPPPPTDQPRSLPYSDRTRIAADVVAKIAGHAAREIPGVYAIGDGHSRRKGQPRGQVGGGTDSSWQGVSVEVGEREAAVELDIITWYGQSIVDVSEAVRRNVIERVRASTGLTVIKVDINIDDVHVDTGSGS